MLVLNFPENLRVLETIPEKNAFTEMTLAH